MFERGIVPYDVETIAALQLPSKNVCIMVIDYLYWQYWQGPLWLLVFLGNVQRYLWQFFSVPFMFRTLLAHWRRDVSSHSGSLDQILMAFVWNGISRAIGFIVRLSVLTIYVCVGSMVLALSVVVWLAFLLWPILVILGIVAGIGLLLGGG